MPSEAATTAATMLFFIEVSFFSPYPVVTMIERSFVRIKSGLVHVAACGAGRPILLLHQTPRSWDEYREVLPLLGARYRAIAMDTVGFGDSQPLPDGHGFHRSLGGGRARGAGGTRPRPRRRRRPSHGRSHRRRDGGVAARARRGAGPVGLPLRRCSATGEGARQAGDRRGRGACRWPASPGTVGEAAALLSGGPRRSSRALHRRCIEGGAARCRRPSRRRPLRDGAAPAAGALPDPGDRAHGRSARPSARARPSPPASPAAN